MAKQKPFTPSSEICPACYKEGNTESKLQYRPGRFEHYCDNGHTFNDREALTAMIMEIKSKIKPVETKPAAKTESIEEGKSEGPEIRQEPQEGFLVNNINKARLEELTGQKITDASSLVGAIFAGQQKIVEIRGELESIKMSSIGKYAGGDLKIQINIPEAHIVPLKDIAEAGALTVEQYMQVRIEEGLSWLWFYLPLIVGFTGLIWHFVRIASMTLMA